MFIISFFFFQFFFQFFHLYFEYEILSHISFKIDFEKEVGATAPYCKFRYCPSYCTNLRVGIIHRRILSKLGDCKFEYIIAYYVVILPCLRHTPRRSYNRDSHIVISRPVLSRIWIFFHPCTTSHHPTHDEVGIHSISLC